MSDSALIARRTPPTWLIAIALGLLAATVLSAGATTGASALPWLWAGMLGVGAFAYFLLRGDLLIAVLGWFATLICLHEEFWRDNASAPFALTIPRLFLAALVVLFVFMLAIGRVRPRLAWPVGWMLLAIVVYFSISAAVSGFITRSPITVHYRLIGGYIFPFIVFLLMLHGLRRENDFRRIAVFFAGLAVYLTYTGWCERFELFGAVWPRFIADPDVGIHWGRVRGPFVMSPAMGLALVYCFFSNLVLARQAKPMWRVALWLLNALMLPAIFWTKTRSVWLSLVVCGLIWVLYSKRRITRAVTVPALVALALSVTVVNMTGFLSEDREKGGVTDVEPILLRVGLAQMTWHMLAEHPLTGVGFGHFRDHAPDFARDPSSPYYAFSSTAMEHNNLLSVLAETGVIGFVLYVAVIALLLRMSVQLYRRLPESAPGFINRDLLVLYWILAAAFLIDGFFRETSDNPFANCLFFGLSAVVASLNILLGPRPKPIPTLGSRFGGRLTAADSAHRTDPRPMLPVRLPSPAAPEGGGASCADRTGSGGQAVRIAVQLAGMSRPVAPIDGSSAPPPDGSPPAPIQVDESAPRGLFASARIQRAMGLYLPATVVFRSLNFARILILTRFMLKQQFGLFSLIQAAVNVMTPLCSFGLAEAVGRYVPQYESRGALTGLVRRSLALVCLFAGFSAALMLWQAPRVGRFLFAQSHHVGIGLQQEIAADAPALATACAVVIALQVLYFYLLAIFKGLRMFTAVSLMEMGQGLLFFLLPLAAVAANMRSALTMTVVFAISLTSTIGYFGLRFAGRLRDWRTQDGPVVTRDVDRSLLGFGLWTCLAGVTWQGLVYYPSWYLNKVHGNEAVAMFTPPRQLGNLILIAAMSVVAIIASAVTKTWESAGRKAADRQWSLAFRACGVGLFLLCAALALAKQWIMPLFGKGYVDGATILPLQLLFFLLGAHLAFLTIHFQLIEKSRLLVWPWVVGVGANAALAWWLAGPTPAAITQSALWRVPGAVFARVFEPGWSDPLGLNAATWCGVLAIGAALAMCLWLIRAEGLRLDRGSRVVIVIAGLLAMHNWLLAIGSVATLVLVMTTTLIFSAEERRELFGVLRGALSHVPRWRSRG